MSKISQTFQSPYSLHKPPCCFTRYLFLSLSVSFVVKSSKIISFFLDLLVHKIFFDKSHGFQILSTTNDWIVSLSLISVTLHSLSISHSIMSSVCKKITSFGFRWKLYCCSSPSHLTRENFVSRFALCLRFIFFVFVFWSIETITANFQGLTHPK